MKWTIKLSPKLLPPGIPPIGTFWRHTKSSIVYLRIADEVGAAICGHDFKKSCEMFYSIGDNGKVSYTFRDRTDFGPLERIPANQIGGLTD